MTQKIFLQEPQGTEEGSAELGMTNIISELNQNLNFTRRKISPQSASFTAAQSFSQEASLEAVTTSTSPRPDAPSVALPEVTLRPNVPIKPPWIKPKVSKRHLQNAKLHVTLIELILLTSSERDLNFYVTR